MTRALLVYPEFRSASFWNYRETCELVDARYPAAPLGLCTVAALLPTEWEVTLVDRNIEPWDDSMLDAADVVLTGGMMPHQALVPWLSIVPIAESRSSYNGLIILTFLVSSALMTAWVIHRFASRATRPSAIWDCGFPLDAPQTQYGSASFSMPIRRVFGTVVFNVHERVDMPKPGEIRAGAFGLRILDPAWQYAYGPMARSVGAISMALNHMQFLTIRRYLTLVFCTLIALLVLVAAWR